LRVEIVISDLVCGGDAFVSRFECRCVSSLWLSWCALASRRYRLAQILLACRTLVSRQDRP
jgi:hypothetical protein